MEKMLNFLDWIEKLKGVRRRITGPNDKDKYESIPDHCFKMTFWSWMAGRNRKDLDWQKSIRMEMVHDLGKFPFEDRSASRQLFTEGRNRVADMVGKKWRKNISIKEKRKIMAERRKVEGVRVRKAAAGLPAHLRREILDLWLEYMRGVSPEAKFANQIGALDSLMQAADCWREDHKFDLEPWVFYARKTVDDPELLKYLAALEKRIKGWQG